MKFNKVTWCFALLVVAGSVCLGQSFGQSFLSLDQSFTGPLEDNCCWWQSFDGGGLGAVAQVYTAGISGYLVEVKISVSAQNGGPVLVEILDPTTNTNGTWAFLGSTTINPPYATDELISAWFFPPIPQVAGSQYAIAVYPGYVAQTWFGSNTSTTYSGGGTYLFGPSWSNITNFYPSLPAFDQVGSFYFQTYVFKKRRSK